MATWLQGATRALIVVALLSAAGLPRIARAQEPAPVPRALLRGIELDSKALAAVARGDAVVQLLATSSDLDVAALGMVRVRCSRESALRYFLDLDRSLSIPGTFARFGDPPHAADVAAVALDESEFLELRTCQPGNCRFKLSASSMRKFANEVDWSSPHAKSEVDRLMRDDVLRAALDYVKAGGRALPAYDDKVAGVRPQEVFARLVDQMSRWIECPPELRRYIVAYPAQRPEGVREVLFWAEHRMPRLRPTLVLSHLAGYEPKGSSSPAFVAKRLLYASHYLDGAFELIAIVPSESAHGDAYLLTVRSYRFDQLPGGVLNVRGRVHERLLDALRSDLERDRRAIEAAGGG